MNRGDVKWPPEDVRQRMVEDKAELEMIAAGPVHRPKKVKKVQMRWKFFSHELSRDKQFSLTEIENNKNEK